MGDEASGAMAVVEADEEDGSEVAEEADEESCVIIDLSLLTVKPRISRMDRLICMKKVEKFL